MQSLHWLMMTTPRRLHWLMMTTPRLWQPLLSIREGRNKV